MTVASPIVRMLMSMARAKCVVALISIVGVGSAPVWAAYRAPVSGTRGVVAADHHLASRAGVEILKRGGNAVDAACATMFALGVVNPAGSGLGGGGFMMIYLATKQKVVVLDFRERAPEQSTQGMFTAEGLPKDASRFSGLAVGIPGEVRGCADALARYGRLSLRQVMAPAIRFARKGFVVGAHLARYIRRMAPRIPVGHPLRKRFFSRGRPLKSGARMRRPRLARTLRAIARRGPRAFYSGWVAADIVRTVRAGGGILSRADLKNYKVTWREPLHTRYWEHDIYLMPPPSSGGIAMIEALNILRHSYRRRHNHPKGYGHNSSAYVHLLAESLKHAFADRAQFLGDTDFVKVPIDRLLADKTAAKLAARVGERTRRVSSYGSRKPTRSVKDDSGTSHLSVIDRSGMTVSLTTSLNLPFGSLLMATRSGVILNNQMDDFATQPGKPNAFGLLQSEANAVAPHKRPLSSMTPTIVLKDGRPVLAVGGSGGPTIITGTLQVLLNVIVFGMDANKAVSVPRIHHQWLPNRLWLEKEFPRDVEDGLRVRGHKFKKVERPFTAIQAAVLRNGRHSGAADPRKHGAAAAF